MGNYFTNLNLRDIRENEYIILVEVARNISTGYVYQYDDCVYRLRKRINIANRGYEGEITENTFTELIESLSGHRDTRKSIIVYDEGYFECQHQIKHYFLMKNYEFKFIPWSKADGCEGLLKKGILKDKFPQFDHDIKSYIEVVSSVEEKVEYKAKYYDKPQSVEKPTKPLHKDNEAQMKSYETPKAISLYPTRTLIMGIEFGTIKCSVAVSRNNQVEVVQDNVGQRSFKSFISFDQSVPVIGNVAFKRLRDKSQYIVYDLQRIIGKEKVQFIERDDLWPFQVRDSENGVEIVTKTSSGEKRFNPTELTAILFKQL
ncbi:hypothetical protein FO519_010075, partial [Halicephalobus sp. NKZ332]